MIKTAAIICGAVLAAMAGCFIFLMTFDVEDDEDYEECEHWKNY